MKRTKKLLALVLALMMALSCMAMPAMAHGDGDEGIMPLYEVVHCPDCGESARVTRKHTGPQAIPSFDCNNAPFEHPHYAEDVYEVRTTCMYCPYDETYCSPSGVTCPYA